MSKKNKLIERLQSRPKDFTWDEAQKVMKLHGFQLLSASGSRRKFIHKKTRTKVILHEPHPQNILLPYVVDALLEGLRAAGEIES